MLRQVGREDQLKWSPNIAYAIGLFTADGNLSSDRRHMEFCSKDVENVAHLRQCLALKSAICLKKRGTPPYRNYYRVQFGNVRLYRILEGLGLKSKKSLTLEAVEIPDSFFPDFLRGFWDGDGGFSTFFHPESYLLQWKARFSSGSLKFLTWLQHHVAALHQLHGKIHRSGRVYQLAYYKRDGFHLLKMMYYRADLVCLTRKKKQAWDLLAQLSDGEFPGLEAREKRYAFPGKVLLMRKGEPSPPQFFGGR